MSKLNNLVSAVVVLGIGMRNLSLVKLKGIRPRIIYSRNRIDNAKAN